MKKSAQVLHKGFTLVELLVVIAIIAILAAVVVLIINPAEILARGRDSSRLADLASLQTAINVAVQESTGSGTLCNGAGGSCNGSSNVDGRNSNGTGWAKVDLSTQKSVSVPTLAVDPTNSATYHYTYCSDGSSWEIDAKTESQRETPKMGNDGGDDPVLYEVGSNLKLVSPSGGTCTY